MFVVRILTQNVYERFWYLAIFTTFINPCPRGYEANVIVVVLFPAIIISGWCMARTRVLVNGILRRVNVVVASVRMKIRVSISATMHVGGTRLREELAVRARKDVGRRSDLAWYPLTVFVARFINERLVTSLVSIPNVWLCVHLLCLADDSNIRSRDDVFSWCHGELRTEEGWASFVNILLRRLYPDLYRVQVGLYLVTWWLITSRIFSFLRMFFFGAINYFQVNQRGKWSSFIIWLDE